MASENSRKYARYSLRVSAGLLAQCRLVAEQDRRSLNSWIEGLMLSAVAAYRQGSAAIPGQLHHYDHDVREVEP